MIKTTDHCILHTTGYLWFLVKWHSWEVFPLPTRSCKTLMLSATQADQRTEHHVSHPAHSAQVLHSLIYTFFCFLFPLLAFKKKIMQQTFSPFWKFPTGMRVSSFSLLVPALLALFHLSAQTAAQTLLTWVQTLPTNETPGWSSCPTTPTQLPTRTAAMRIRYKPHSATPNTASLASSASKSRALCSCYTDKQCYLEAPGKKIYNLM